MFDPSETDLPDDAIFVDLAADPESQNWLKRGRTDEESSLQECSDAELEDRIEEAKQIRRSLPE